MKTAGGNEVPTHRRRNKSESLQRLSSQGETGERSEVGQEAGGEDQEGGGGAAVCLLQSVSRFLVISIEIILTISIKWLLLPPGEQGKHLPPP